MNPFLDALERLKAHALKTVREQPESNWLPFLRNQAADEGIEYDVRDSDLLDLINEAQRALQAPERDSSVMRGGQRIQRESVESVVPGFIKKGALHLFVAEQGAGKSNLMLYLFRSLFSEQQTGKFLNLDILISKKWRLFLIGPDMSKDSWLGPIENYGLGTAVPGGSGVDLIPELVCYPSETGMSLSAQDIALYREMALESTAKGELPLFVFDSYNALLANFMEVDERTQKFVKPLRDLNKAMAGTGATTVVLHHTPKGQSNSTASAGGGHNSLGSVPDVVIEMSAMGRNSDRYLLESAKRIERTCLMVQQHYEEGRWECHGDAAEAAAQRELLDKIDGLKGHKLRVYDMAELRWDTQKLPFDSQMVVSWCDGISIQYARRIIRWMESKGLIWHCDDQGHDHTAGRPKPLYIPSEYKVEWIKARKQRNKETYETYKEPQSGTGKSIATREKEPKEIYERGNVTPPPENINCETKEPLGALGNKGNLGNLGTVMKQTKQPEVNAYGQPVPRVGLQVEDGQGKNGLVITEVINGIDVKVQALGNAKGPIKRVRWWVDVFPCGFMAKPGEAL